MPGIVRDGFEIGKAVFDQGQAAGRLLDQVRAQRDRGLIAVDADHLAVGGRKNGARIAAGTEGAVDIDAAVADIEEANSMAAEHGNVEGRSAPATAEPPLPTITPALQARCAPPPGNSVAL